MIIYWRFGYSDKKTFWPHLSIESKWRRKEIFESYFNDFYSRFPKFRSSCVSSVSSISRCYFISDIQQRFYHWRTSYHWCSKWRSIAVNKNEPNYAKTTGFSLRLIFGTKVLPDLKSCRSALKRDFRRNSDIWKIIAVQNDTNGNQTSNCSFRWNCTKAYVHLEWFNKLSYQ